MKPININLKNDSLVFFPAQRAQVGVCCTESVLFRKHTLNEEKQSPSGMRVMSLSRGFRIRFTILYYVVFNILSYFYFYYVFLKLERIPSFI